MNSLLKPERLDLDPSSPNAAKEWKHWLRTFINFIEECGDNAPNKHRTIVNLMTHNVYDYVEDCENYDSVIETLNKIYIKSPNEVFARHLLATRIQQPGESIDEFLQKLKTLSKDCNLKAVTAQQYKQELICDAFINGLQSPLIRQRLLENKTLTLEEACNQANSLDLAQRNANAYSLTTPPGAHVAFMSQDSDCQDIEKSPIAENVQTHVTAAAYQKKCWFCGNHIHNRRVCPARDAFCNNCGIKGHFMKMCKSKRQSNNQSTSASIQQHSLCAASISAAFPEGLSHSITSVSINNCKLSALIDSGSSDNFINEQTSKRLNLHVNSSSRTISMATTSLNSNIAGQCVIDLNHNGHIYPNVRLGVLKDLCCDIILGYEFQKLHKRLVIELGGPKPELNISNSPTCALASSSIEATSLFANVDPKCKPIATKSRRFNYSDREFIKTEINRLMTEGIIESSTSPWRAQVVIARNPSQPDKRRLCIDYSQTINLYTELDAYPLPRIDEMINSLAQYRIFSTFDLKSAYHQISINDSDRKFTGFEANKRLYQFTRIPFGVTNGVAVFQRQMDKIITEEHLAGTFPYLDDITVAGHTQEEHDTNVKAFLDVVEKLNLTLNESKSILSASNINVLGYLIGDGLVKPDPERLRPLRELPPPSNVSSLRRALGMFAYYAKWIHDFSEKIQLLVNTKVFPLNKESLEAFNNLKRELEKASLIPIDETIPFIVECDASENTISATLNQGGRPVAFMSRTLQSAELHYPAVEKEATAIIEAVRKWEHLLARRNFTLITDQRSVAFMLDNRKRTKIKNNKIQGWRLELASFGYTIKYRPGIENVGPDTLTRALCATLTSTLSKLQELHNNLCHPGVTRLLHFVKTKNLPYSTDDVKKVCSSCKFCAQLKPQFYNASTNTLIKATQPMERLSVDFKGPLPSATNNKYILTIIDEYSRFPFAFPCKDTSSSSVIKCFDQLFSLFGLPNYIHSDRGSSFMSHELKNYLSNRGVSSSRTTPYHPIGNSQCERYNGIIWKTIQLALKTHALLISQWEIVLPDALHSIRSLLSTATNSTPHERFLVFQRRSSIGMSLPSWLSTPGPIMVRRFVRHTKNDPFVDEVELTEVNPSYAHIRYPDGRESTVSVKDLSPCPRTNISQEETRHNNSSDEDESHEILNETFRDDITRTPVTSNPTDTTQNTPDDNVIVSGLRRSTRTSKPPDRLDL